MSDDRPNFLIFLNEQHRGDCLGCEGHPVLLTPTMDELAAGVFEGWLHSPDHRDNILTPEWNREGIGVTVAEGRQVFVTQNFC